MLIAARICYALQIFGLVAGACTYPYGALDYFGTMLMRLFFFDGVMGFSYTLGQFFFLYLGWFFRFLHGRNVKKKEVVFYCPTCKEVYSASPRSGQICLICRKKAKEIPVLAREFNRLPEDQKQMILNTAVAEPAPVQAPPAKAPVSAPEATAFLPPEPEVPAAPVQPVAPVQPQVQKRNVLLCLRTGPMAGRIYSCPNGAPVVIGRNPSRSNLALSQYGKVSSAHCRLECADGVLRVTDLGSTNGTFLNGAPLTPNAPAILRDGDTLMLGTEECQIRIAFE